MKPLLFSILFLFFNTINPFAQDRKIIFPEDKIISHDDSMGIILIDHIYHRRREKAVEMLNSGKVGGHVRDMNGNYAIQHAMQQFDTNMISLLIEKGALLQHSEYPVFLWKDFCNAERFTNFRVIEQPGCGTRGWDLPTIIHPPDTIIADFLTRKHLRTVNAASSRSDMTDYFLMRGNSSMTKKFLDRGVLFSDSFQTFNSPIIAACLSGDFELFKLFVDMGYKINKETVTGQNALHYACYGGDSKIITYLISKGLDMKKVSQSIYYLYPRYYTLSTPLLCLLSGKLKSPEAIQLFFDKGVKIKKSDYWVYLFKNRYNYIPEPDPENMYKAVEI